MEKFSSKASRSLPTNFDWTNSKYFHSWGNCVFMKIIIVMFKNNEPLFRYAFCQQCTLLGCWCNAHLPPPNFGRVSSMELPWSCFLRFLLHSIQLVACAIIAGTCFFFFIRLTYLFLLFTFHMKKIRMRDFLHRGDRAMIYIFIASSYFPWLSLMPNLSIAAESTIKSSSSLLPRILSSLGVSTLVAADLRWLVWFLAAMGILYQQIFHEKYKWLETLIYVVIGLLPSLPFVHSVSFI